LWCGRLGCAYTIAGQTPAPQLKIDQYPCPNTTNEPYLMMASKIHAPASVVT